MNRILQTLRPVDSRQTGGVEELLLMFCPALRRHGRFDTSIFLLRKPNPEADPARDFGGRARALGIHVLSLAQVRWSYPWLGAVPRGLDISIVHMHGQRANYVIWLLRRLYPRTWGRLPLVATVHGWVQDNRIRRIVTRLEWMTLRDCDHVITVSEQQRQTLLARGHAPDRVTVIRPGIPYNAEGAHGRASAEQRAAARARWGIPADAYVITAVGRLSTEKRFDLYLETCAALAARLPEATFLLVGGGKCEQALKAQAAELGLTERLIFTGLTREMESIYAATDLLLLTSDTEGTPHVLLEAMGSAIPVIATAVGGIPEFITDGEHGLLVPPGNRDALVAAALRIHDDPALAARLVAGGAQVAGEFTVPRMVAGVEQVYDTVLDRRTAGAR